MNYILGLDVSTSKLGLSILDTSKNLVKSQTIKLDNKTSLEDRCLVVEHILTSLYSVNHINKKSGYNITKVYIESPFMMFSGGKTTAMTMSKLQRFNGMVSYMVRKIFGFDAVPIAANKARGAIGLKIKRGENTKKKVIEWVKQRYPDDFIFELTRYGNPKPGTDDKADAIVIALAGLILNQ
jgi:Holliday junction resolvasome RuvABC endonuclease subunit